MLCWAEFGQRNERLFAATSQAGQGANGVRSLRWGRH